MRRIEWEFVKSWRDVQFADSLFKTIIWDDLDLDIHFEKMVLDIRVNPHYKDPEIYLGEGIGWHPAAFTVIRIQEDPV